MGRETLKSMGLVKLTFQVLLTFPDVHLYGESYKFLLCYDLGTIVAYTSEIAILSRKSLKIKPNDCILNYVSKPIVHVGNPSEK